MATAPAAFTIAPPRYRLPAGLTLGSVKLQVSDLARSVAYYERVVGLRVLHRGDTTARLGVQGSDETLVELHEKRGVHAVPQRGLLGLYHFAILLPTRAALGQFLAHLRELGTRAGMSDHLVSEAIYLYDPDGLGIEVYADRPREEWRVDGASIAMATDPIDVPDLIAAGGNDRWTGAPAGTCIGHVHLFVGDLDEAANFYHESIGFDRVTLQFRGALFMSAGGYHHHLGTNIWAAGAPSATDNDARLLEWNVHLPQPSDVAEVTRSLEAGGNSAWLEDGTVRATDPWGTNVRFSSRPSA